MTPQEIIEYNKRCAQFLCWKYNPETSIHFPKGTWIDKNNVGHCVEKGLRFHSDWNWIMEIKNHIIGLGYCWFQFPDIIQINENFTISSKSIYKVRFDKLQEKEAVVEAINQFLIWYEKQKES